MPITDTSANVCCYHDEDDRREVRLEMRRWSKVRRRSRGQPMKVAAMKRMTVRGRQQHHLFTIGIERLLHR